MIQVSYSSELLQVENALHISVNRRLAEFLKQQALLGNESLASQRVDNKAATYQTVVQGLNAMTLSDWWQQWQDAALINGWFSAQALPKKILSDFEAQWLMEQSLQAIINGRNESVTNADHNHPESLPAGEESLFAENNDDWSDIALLNISQTAKKLYQAYAMAGEYLPADWPEQNMNLPKESRLLIQVTQQYLQVLAHKQYADALQQNLLRQGWLKTWVDTTQQKLSGQGFSSPAGWFAHTIYLHGFDELTPFAKQWGQQMQALGAQVYLVAAGGKNCSVAIEKFSASDPVQEVQQASLWAVQQAQSKRRIGLVAADLNLYKPALLRCLDEQALLMGQQKLNVQTQAFQKLYNVSLGESLLQLPMVQSALLSARIFLQKNRLVAYQDWSQWLCSAYTFGDLGARYAFDQKLRRLQWGQFQWSRLLTDESASDRNGDAKDSNERLVSQWDWPKALTSLKQQLVAWQCHELPAKMILSEFIHAFKTCLQTLGWPGNRTLSSFEYQQKESFESALHAFSELMDLGRLDYRQWLKLLTRFLGEQIFQPKSQGSEPIQIMGMLEAAGQEFDALWVLGMTENDWPRAAQPNPFLPMNLQLQYELPRADAHRELRYASQVTQRLFAASSSIVVSYPMASDQQENLFSPLMHAMLQALCAPNNPSNQHAYRPVKFREYLEKDSPSVAAEQLMHRLTAPTWELDAQGTPMDIGSRAPGGTGILCAQSLCPLMAYVDYRLGAKYGFQAVEEALQHNLQGTLIHRVMELFWLEFQDSKTLLSKSDDTIAAYLQTTIREVYQQALPQAQQDPLIQLEQNRVLALCMDWLAMERQREPFSVLKTEEKFRLRLSGVEFVVVVDRIDETDCGLLVVDYKTGKATISDLFSKEGQTMRAPQLAVYLSALKTFVKAPPKILRNDGTAGIGYGILHTDEGVKFNALLVNESVLGEWHFKANGRSKQSRFFEQESQSEKSEFFEMPWPVLLESLEQEVAQIAAQIQKGEAPMTFAFEEDLAWSAGLLALRLPEVKQQLQMAQLRQAQTLAEGKA